MPKAVVSEVNLPDAALVIQQRRIPAVVYPFEGSFTMLRGAAACVLKVNIIANRFGYELSDCHGFNVVFDGARPCFVDLGSLVPRPKAAMGCTALEEFVRFYHYRCASGEVVAASWHDAC